jgi:NAD(P)-dependent dehydrogenase (short-subunit alcohol dehydrogenase family)
MTSVEGKVVLITGGTSGIGPRSAGAFRTPMLEHVFEVAGGGGPEGPAEVEAVYTGLVPMRRIGRPEEAAGWRSGCVRIRPRT